MQPVAKPVHMKKRHHAQRNVGRGQLIVFGYVAGGDRQIPVSDGDPLGSSGAAAGVKNQSNLIGIREGSGRTPRSFLERNAHHDAAPLLGDFERTVARPRLHGRHACSPSSSVRPSDILFMIIAGIGCRKETAGPASAWTVLRRSTMESEPVSKVEARRPAR